MARDLEFLPRESRKLEVLTEPDSKWAIKLHIASTISVFRAFSGVFSFMGSSDT